jgi:hypothetical protein
MGKAQSPGGNSIGRLLNPPNCATFFLQAQLTIQGGNMVSKKRLLMLNHNILQNEHTLTR